MPVPLRLHLSSVGRVCTPASRWRRFPGTLALPDSSALRYYEGSDSCRRHRNDRSPGLSRPSFPTFRLQPREGPADRFARQLQRLQCVPGFAFSQPARRPPPAESSSSSCGPPVRLRLLSTPPRDDAVTFGYGVLACPDTDFHRAECAPSPAHWERPVAATDADTRQAVVGVPAPAEPRGTSRFSRSAPRIGVREAPRAIRRADRQFVRRRM